MNFNNRPLNEGAIFVQVVIALAMVGIMLSATLGLQMNVFRAVVKNALMFEHRISLEVLMTTAQKDRVLRKEKNSYEKMLKDPEMKLSLQKEQIQNNSTLARFNQLFKQTSRGLWTDWSGSQVETLTSFVFIPKQKENEDEKK